MEIKIYFSGLSIEEILRFFTQYLISKEERLWREFLRKLFRRGVI